MTTNITEEHRRVFAALASGEPEYELRPLFVSVTDDMALTDHDGREA